MNNLQKRIEDLFLNKIRESGTNKESNYLVHIPNLLFKIQQNSGISLNKIKKYVWEIIDKNQENYMLVPTTCAWADNESLEGERGAERILKWYLKDSCYYSHLKVIRKLK